MIVMTGLIHTISVIVMNRVIDNDCNDNDAIAMIEMIVVDYDDDHI